MIGQMCKKVLKWSLPYGLLEFSRLLRRDFKYSRFYLNRQDPLLFKVLQKNSVFKDKHKGERCFILGTGPSINKIDISKLKNENCIFLSQFYLHEDYKKINPKYHFFSGICLHDDINNEKGLEFYAQIEERIPLDTIIFLNYLDYKFVTENGFLRNHKVLYLRFKRDLDDLFRKKIDATKILCGMSGISTMAIQLALYMGFKNIYLLGIDHCSHKGPLGVHFYDQKESVVDELPLDDRDELFIRETTWRMYLNLFDEYRVIRAFAESKGIKMYNATRGGILSLFPRVDFDSLF